MEKQQFESWKEDVMPAIVTKVEEFHFLGYGRVTTDEVWNCVMDRLRKQTEFMRLHAFVQVILTLKIQDYMTWLTKQSYQSGTDWFKDNESIL
ncbi:post-transcriptional regulator [Bacillus sp. FJAT-45037]|uniref:post-transcriptional regulator n=1 Tax=Bacillus sp. FJAT-45037 TaxID=2011007 RepID=UPI000C251735|nr:post-transcriptional regulator [Bacillus sp. FJAT-45037]